MNWGKGLVVLGSVGGKPTKFLVDTGAAISIMSTGMFRGLSDHPLKLQNIDLDICAANGRSLEVLGMVNLDLTIGPLHVQHDIIVADI